jgi:hypothetical protein
MAHIADRIVAIMKPDADAGSRDVAPQAQTGHTPDQRE